MSKLSFIKWSGSKRHVANQLIEKFPKKYVDYYEPFIGSGSLISLLDKEKNITISDNNKTLIELYKYVKNNPVALINEYRKRHEQFLQKGENYYYQVRSNFNETRNIFDFYFLTRTCVNGLIRYNNKGDFNSPVHKNRWGMKPDKLEKIISNYERYLSAIKIRRCDYKEIFNKSKSHDFIFLDPPYVASKTMYNGHFNHQDFFEELELLNQKEVKWLLTFDSDKSLFPKELYKNNYDLVTGLNSYKRMKGEKSVVTENIYTNY